MALDPGNGVPVPPGPPGPQWIHAGGSGPWRGLALLNAPPQYTFPDYNALLEQYMAPFRALFEAQIGKLSEDISRQQEFAKKQEALSLSNLNQQHDVNTQTILNTMAARGLAESGEQPYRTNLENKSYSNAKSSLQNALSNTLAALASQLEQAKYAGLMGLEQQQLGLIPFIQNTYQPTAGPTGYARAAGAPGGSPSGIGPTPPARPASWLTAARG